MYECNFHGHKLTFWTRNGELIDLQESQTTSVTGSEDANARISISSNTTKKSVLWIKEENGTVFDVLIYNFSMPLRKGQSVSVLGVSKINNSNGYYCAIKNKNTNEYFIISHAKDLLKYLTKENKLIFKIISNIFFYGPPAIFAGLELANSFPKGKWGLQNIILMHYLPKYIFYLLGWVVILIVFGTINTLPKNIRMNRKIKKIINKL